MLRRTARPAAARVVRIKSSVGARGDRRRASPRKPRANHPQPFRTPHGRLTQLSTVCRPGQPTRAAAGPAASARRSCCSKTRPRWASGTRTTGASSTRQVAIWTGARAERKLVLFLIVARLQHFFVGVFARAIRFERLRLLTLFIFPNNRRPTQAAKRGLDGHIGALGLYGADVNAKNVAGNTPLHVRSSSMCFAAAQGCVLSAAAAFLGALGGVESLPRVVASTVAIWDTFPSLDNGCDP